MAEQETSEQEQLDLTEGSDRTDDVVRHWRPGKVNEWEQEGPEVRLTCTKGIMLILQFVTQEIVQVSYLVKADVKPDVSYAIDPEFEAAQVSLSTHETGEAICIASDTLQVSINKETMRLTYRNAEGEVLCEDADGYYRRDSLMDGIQEVKITQKAPPGTRYYGLGDKPVEQDLRGRTYENWCTDSYAYERGSDPLYRSVPFYIAARKEHAYGIFMDNTYRSTFNFDADKNRKSSFSAAGGVMNYYFILGPEPTRVVQRYTKLTGMPAMPPMWALGYHQCRWSYYPEEEVKALARAFREHEIPCDAIYLDIDYMDAYRCFTWNTSHFPDPKAMIAALKASGFKTIVMIDPGIKVDDAYFVYKQGHENGYFCKRTDGEEMVGPVWPPECAFPDYTHPNVRRWWADLYEPFMKELHVDGIWNDMNEPAMFNVNRKTFPDTIRHHYEGAQVSHKRAHNIYGMQMARASFNGIKKHAPERRPFLLTRSNYAGGQRYAALWTGDNIATWDHLKLASEQCVRLSTSGYSFVGSDVGGFVEQPSPELLVRWLQLGAFHPLFRNHSMGYNVDGAAAVTDDAVEQQKQKSDKNQEPWVFGEPYTSMNRQAIHLRYRLLSYLYTAFYEYVTEGMPILRPAAFAMKTEGADSLEQDAFLFGQDVLVAPAFEEGQRSVDVRLPEGDWYDFWSGKRLAGDTAHTLHAPLERIPFVVRAGTVLPLRPVMQHTGAHAIETMTLHVYHHDTDKKSTFYEDAEEGWEYTKGEYRHTTFCYAFDANEQRITLGAEVEGRLEPSHHTYEVRLFGIPFPVTKAMADGEEVPVREEADPDTPEPVYTVKVASDFSRLELGR